MKSLFRRGKCNAALGALDEAKADFDLIMSIEPENRDALRELHALKQKFKEHDRHTFASPTPTLPLPLPLHPTPTQ